MTTINHLTRELMDWYDRQAWIADRGPLIRAALVELAAAEPVPPGRIATRAAVPASEALDFLQGSPAEWDEQGRLVGFGLTLRETPHRFTTEGRTLYTWCAPDALSFPAVLGTPAHIESPCFATGQTVTVDVAPDGIRALTPASAVVSMVPTAAGLGDLRQRLCHQQHFFASAQAAAGWHADRPDALLVPVPDSFEPLRALVDRWAAPSREAA